MKIPGYSGYEYIDGKVFNLKTGKEVTQTPRGSTFRVTLNGDDGRRVPLPLSRIQALCCPPSVPDGFVLAYGCEKTYINKSGEVWTGPSQVNPLGQYLKPRYRAGDYVYVSVEGRTVTLHGLLVKTFIDPEYARKGLCVMHLDNDKHNYCLSNLKLGTYSENNKAAYRDGLNPL